MKWDSTDPLGQKLLTGEVLKYPQTSKITQAYFESIANNKKSIKKITHAHLSLEEYKKFWKRKKEGTVTSPFGLHVGHYKAACQNDLILNVHRIMRLLPFQTGLVPNRWRKTVQTMLEKDQGQPWVHRLRIIELFDAQVNAGFQVFIGRKMVWEAVKNQQLHPASYGSTPGKWLHRQSYKRY